MHFVVKDLRQRPSVFETSTNHLVFDSPKQSSKFLLQSEITGSHGKPKAKLGALLQKTLFQA